MSLDRLQAYQRALTKEHRKELQLAESINHGRTGPGQPINKHSFSKPQTSENHAQTLAKS